MDLTTGIDSHDPFVLPDGFWKEAQKVAEQQAALDGFRLADLFAH